MHFETMVSSDVARLLVEADSLGLILPSADWMVITAALLMRARLFFGVLPAVKQLKC